MYSRILILILLILQSSCSFTQKYSDEVIPYGEPPISAQAHFFTGLIEEDNLNWRVAAMHFDHAARLGENNARIYIHLARCLIFLKKYNECIDNLEYAEKSAKKNDYLIWFDMGEMYHILRMKENARVCYEKALNIFPRFEKANYALTELDKI